VAKNLATHVDVAMVTVALPMAVIASLVKNLTNNFCNLTKEQQEITIAEERP
jgi:hypothetical protein